jgi:rhodanese-related sulfurtransferase
MSMKAGKKRAAALSGYALALILAVGVVASAPAGLEVALAGASPDIKTLSIEEGYALVKENGDNPDFVVIDVRTDAEFREGHLEKALNHDYYADAFREDLDALDRTKTYFVYCRSGSRSARAVEVMGELGFMKLFNLNGGYVEWEKKGYPVAR